MHRLLTAALAALVMLAACDQDRPGTDEADTTLSRDSATTQSPSAAPGDTTRGPRSFDPIDPETGTVVLTATGQQPGKWTFRDVNATVIEQAGGGETRMMMQIEAHDDPVHFKIRLVADDEIEPGRYTIGAQDKGVDATYENSGRFYKSIGGATGNVELTRATDDRAAGSYQLVLETLEEKPVIARVSGTFNLRVQR